MSKTSCTYCTHLENAKRLSSKAKVKFCKCVERNKAFNTNLKYITYNHNSRILRRAFFIPVFWCKVKQVLLHNHGSEMKLKYIISHRDILARKFKLSPFFSFFLYKLKQDTKQNDIYKVVSLLIRIL